MKKFSLVIMSLLFVCACSLFSACAQNENASITLNKTNTIIYLGETENNQVSVLATLKNANAKMLTLVYDTSFINVSQKQNDDGTFTITVTSKVDISTMPIAVEVKYGNASATFYVEIILPVENIVAQNDLFVAYNGERTYCNLRNFISFEPEGTKQTGVNFSLLEENENWYINENQLIIKEGVNVNDLSDVKINAVSNVEGKSDIGTVLNISLIPNVKLLADKFDTKITFNGEETNVKNNFNYELKVEKTKDGYTLSEFILKVTIPNSLGIDVDLSPVAGGGYSTNILNYLSYQKTHMVENSGSNMIDVYTFTFSLKSKLLGEGDLYLNYWYKNYANDENLSAVFVGESDSEIIEKIHVSTVMPIADIKVDTDSAQNPTTKVYTVYQNYGNSIGEMFKFVALPEGTSQKELILEKSANSALKIFGSNGLEIVFDSQNKALINSGDIIYIKGGTNTTEKLTCYSVSNLTIKSEIDLNVVAGASGLGFVPSTDSTSTQDQIVLNVEKGNTVSTYIYSPGVINKNELKHNLKEDAIDAELTPNYFKVTFNGDTIGKQTYTISTANGFEINATINVIQPIEELILQLKNNTEFAAGIGDYVVKDNNLVNISLENGYSAQLEYITNKNAEITHIEYKFYNPSNIDVYGEEFANLKDVKNYNFGAVNFDFMSSIINTQNLISSNVLTAKNTGVNIVEIKIYGYKANENGVISEELKGTKYLFVQVYNPVKTIESTAKNITLRAENQLSVNNKSLATKTLSLKALSLDGNATYNKIFIDGGKYVSNDNNELLCETIIKKSGEDLLKIVYNNSTKQLEITATNVNSSTAGVYSITLFAGDFVDYNNYDTIRSELLTLPVVRYIININLIETKVISEINVSNLSVEKEETNSKTYKTIYLDTSKGNLTYRLFTEIEPFDAFDKSIEYTYTANSGDTQALVSVSNDGLITVLSDQGGVGYISISPKDKSLTNVKTVIIPVVVLDGNSWETAYEITSLDEITNANKHYVLTIPTIYMLNATLFENLETGFKGGLYGVRFADKDKSVAKATIQLNKVSLFNVLANTAIVSHLNICGDVEKIGYVKNGETTITEFNSRGFVANVNNGTIDNVKITTYLISNIYAPSVLTIGKSVTKVGGIVGANFGTISNSIFAGSINLNGNSVVEKVNSIAGENSGTITNCGVIISKFDASLKDSNRVVEHIDGETTIYTNGIIGKNNKFDDISDQIKEDSYESHSFVDAISIKNYSDELGKHAYGEEGVSYGLVFYYQAQDLYLQNKYKNEFLSLNTISLSNLLNIIVNGSTENTLNIIKTLKISALNTDGSVCGFVTIGSDSITINGTGAFILNITSEYDYTTNYQINMLSVFNAGKFTFSSNGIILNSGSDILELIKGQSYDLVSKLDTFITLNKNGVPERINLSRNNFELSFNYSINNSTEQSASNFITGKYIGSHTINATFDWDKVTTIIVRIISGNGENFDSLLNKAFNVSMQDEDDIIAGEFRIIKKIGTTEISTDIKEGAIEPNDTFSFVATLTTDASNDKIDETCISIINEYNFDVTENFNIIVEKDSRTNSFKISINANRNKMGKVLDYVNKKYTIKVFAISDVKQKYNVFGTVEMTLLPQTISNINSTLYNISTLTTTGINVSNSETPTSVLIPSLYGGLFVVDMFPSYASFDYLDIVATSNSTYKLAFRLQDQQDGQNYTNATKGFSAIEGKNGIRIYNTDLTDKPSSTNTINQNIGKYFIKIFTPTYSGDAIFTITVNAYYNNEELPAKSVFTLYMKMPEAPQLSLNGQTKVYSLAGEKIENITCLIANDQLSPTTSIVAIDGKQTNNIDRSIIPVSDNENTTIGYKKYIISIFFNDSYRIDSDSAKFKLVVTSKKITNGTEVSISSDMSIYVVDYIPNDTDIVLAKSVNNILKVNSIKSQELSLAELTKSIKATIDFKDKFNSNYYFQNDKTGFAFGTNIYDGKENLTLGKAETLASYISYVNGNIKTPLLKLGQDNKFDVISNKYLTFELNDNNLYVKGGDYTGTTEMILEIPYTMPDGRQFTYEYKFQIVHEPYSNGDDEDSRPKEIANVKDFIGIENENEALHFILTNDLYLYDYTTIANTDKIASFDGNNHTIYIVNFAESQNNNFALFNVISANTTIKNLTVNIYHLNEIKIESTTENINAAGFAIQNNGAIYNCEVMAFKSSKLVTMSSTFGIKINKDVNADIAGFVLTNNGSITNSRVGGTSKLFISYNKDTNKVSTTSITTNMLSIIASGNISGFVGENNGIISSSFVKNVNITNTYYKQETLVTAGFANTNNGVISLSYAEGDFVKDSDIQSEIGGLQGSGILTGFVYENNNKITDCYSNLFLTNYQEQVGRLGAGFIYYNGENGVIERCYSASKIVSNNIAQMNFAGIKDFGGYNNDGQIKTSYYYAPTSSSIITIESVLNTSITAITSINSDADGSVNPGKDFYGFSFKKDEYAGTWAWSERGPKLVDANDIAHSFRAKYELKTAEGAEQEFQFLYVEGYEIGTKTNPIIIRNAKEFNLVLGGNTSSEKAEKFDLTTSKIFGAYRLVNNIDLLELVPQEEQETEYKVNLLSTKMTLTGEFTRTTQGNGSFNGNGLTIKNLAISNADTSSENFGLFKSIESGASISNLNIEVADAGVSADHTTFVGTLAGSLVDAYAYNISIKTSKINDYTQVIGANVTGGAFGRVVGNSIVSNIELENISAVSTYYKSYFREEIVSGTNLYQRDATNSSSYKEISLAGGAFGVIDIYNRDQLASDESKYGAEDYVYSQITTIAVKGGLKVEAMTVGGIAGFIGEYVIARDLSLTIAKESNPTYLTAYNCYAGGIVGYNKGYLYQIKVEHESAWQTEIESNMYNYYHADENGKELIDRGSEDIFESKLDYKPAIVGGLVGYEYGGKLNVGYSKLNVINQNASYIGGIIGYSQAVSADENTKDSSKSLQIKEIYAVGDVYSGASGARVAGLIGYNEDVNVLIDKFNAMNYWGKKSFDLFKTTEQINATINGQSGIQNNNSQSGSSSEASSILSLKNIKFGEDAKNTHVLSTSSDLFNSYYSYQGVHIDNGAQIDLMFNEKGWYKENNWNRELTETFPHIMYVSPNNIYEISTTEDFKKFAMHWNSNATFIVTQLIDCQNWQSTLGTIRGTIVGATNECGFKNLNYPLFSSTINSTISTLTFNNCRAAFVEDSTATNYSDLIYTNCKFAIIRNGNLAGVTYTTKNGTFKNISFDSDCSLFGAANNVGYIFATGTESINVNNIKIRRPQLTLNATISSNINDYGINIGKIFGYAGGTVTMSKIDLYDNMNITLNSQNSTLETGVSIGLIGGQADTLELSLLDVKLETTGEGIAISAAENIEPSSATLYLGGIIGKTTELIFADTELNNATSLYFSPKIKVSNTYFLQNQYLGSVCGSASTISTSDKNAVYNFGADKDGEKTIFKTFEFSLANSNNYIGGIVGGVAEISGEGAICYYGDMSFTCAESEKESNRFLNLGGIAGIISKSESDNSIQNIIFEGTISLEPIANNTNTNTEKLFNSLIIRAGGLVGFVDQETKTTIKNSVASGEITVTRQLGSEKYIAGIVGFNNGDITLGIENENTAVVCLTTLMANQSTTGVDAIANTAGTITIGNAKYCSTLTLSISSNAKSVNSLYSDITAADENNTSGCAIYKVAEEAGIKGSKISPYLINDLPYVEKVEGVNQKDMFGYTQTREGSKLIKTLFSSYTRKLYVKVDSVDLSSENSNYQISLENTVLFGGGANGGIIKTYHTPINNIDEKSAVSGIISKIYIDEEDNTIDSATYTNLGGLVNTNNGTIYTCSVQERLNDTVDNSTHFFGYIHIEKAGFGKNRVVGGLVGTNTGKIFGSNCNISLSSNIENATLSGFVGTNTKTGIITYCYASGTINVSSNQDKNGSGYYLFAAPTSSSNNSTTFEGNFENCYTIVKPSNDNKLNTSLPTNVITEADSIEMSDTATKALYGTTKSFGNDPYYDCNSNYNYNYPTLSKGAFENITFLKRCTMLNFSGGHYVELTSENNSPVNSTENENNSSSDSGPYFQIPNLKVLQELETLIGSQSYFVIISNINVGYTGTATRIIETLSGVKILDGQNKELRNIILNSSNLIGRIEKNDIQESSTLKNIKFAGDISFSSNGIIGSVGSGVTLDNIGFTEGAKVNIDTKTDTTTTTTYGVLVGTNSGTIQNSKSSLFITTNGEAPEDKSYILGGLVGKNEGGIVQNCKFTGSVQVIEKNNVNVTFGAVIGENNGTAKQLHIENTASKKNYKLTSGGTICKQNEKLEWIKAINNASADSLQSDQYSASIFVLSKGTSTVGGVVGIHSGGTIAYCSNNSHILVGDEANQMLAYAGGIVGSVITDSEINNCSNLGDVTAMSVWLLTTNQKSEDGDIEGSLIEDSGVKKLYYNKANIDTILKYDDSKNVYVYREMVSRAYAGGIAGSGITATADKGYILLNYGTVSGGFRAIKPIATITIDEKTSDLNSHANEMYKSAGLIYGGYVSAGVGGTMIANSIPAIPLGGAGIGGIVAGALTLFGGIGLMIAQMISFDKHYNAANEILQNPILTTNGLCGCSGDYYSSVEFVNIIFNGNFHGSQVVAQSLQLALGGKDKKSYPVYITDKDNFGFYINDNGYKKVNVIDNEDEYFNENGSIKDTKYYTYDDFKDNLKEYIGSSYIKAGHKAMVAMNTAKAATKGVLNIWNKFENFISKFTKVSDSDLENIKTLKRYEKFFINFDFVKINDKSNTKITSYSKYSIKSQIDETINQQAFTCFNYDGICPDINSENNTIWSNISNFEEDFSLHTGNKQNQELKYKGLKDKYTQSSSVDNIDKDKNFWHESSGKWTTGKAPTSIVNDFKTNGDRLSYVLTESDKWADLVYTINNKTWTDNTALKDKLIDITINLSNGETEINVGDAVFNIFNGSIISKTKYKFTNVIASTGLIETTSVCTLKNIIIEGDIGIEYKAKKTETTENKNDTVSNHSAGILVGEVTEVLGDWGKYKNDPQFVIDTVSIYPNSINFTGDSSSSLTNFGGLVGNINKNTKAKISSVVVGTSSKPFNVLYTEESQSASENGGNFGVIIGCNNGEEVNVINIKTFGDISLSSHFNNVGGIVGNNLGTLNIKNKDNNNDNSTLNVSLIVASSKTAYVGGLIGNNSGKVTISQEINIGNLTPIIISADVLKEEAETAAYAGGLVGYYNNNSSSFSIQGVNVRFSESGSGYQNISYILAGYNVLSKSSDALIYPSNANASFAYGNTKFSGVDNNISYENFIVKFIYKSIKASENKKDIKWNAELKDIQLTDEKDNEISIFPFTFYEGDTILNTTINITKDFENIESIKDVTNDEKIDVSVMANKSAQHTKSSLSYKLIERQGMYKSSSINLSNEREWELQVTYTKTETRYGINTTKMIIGDQEESTIKAIFKYKIELVHNNYKIDSADEYILKITQLNDYNIEAEEIQKYVFKTKNIYDDQNKTEIVVASYDEEEIIYLETWTEDKDYNKVIFAEPISKIDSNGIEVNNILSSVSTMSYENTNSKTDGETEVKIESATLSNNKFLIKYESSQLVIQEQIQLKCEQKIIKQSGEDVTSSSYSCNKDITRTLLTIDANDVSTKMTGTKHDFSADVSSKISAAINEFNLKIEGNDGTSTNKEITTYNKNLTLGGAIEVNYNEPYYMVEDKSFDYFNVYQYTTNGKTYLVISLADENFNVTEHFYQVDGNNYNYHGYISYKLTSEAYNNCFINNVPERYESMFPTLECTVDSKEESYAEFISNIRDNLTTETITSSEPIINNIYIVYTDAKIAITANTGDLFYSYEITYTTYKQKLSITTAGITIALKPESDSTSTTTNNIVYISSSTVLNELITADELTSDKGLKIYSDSGEEGNISINELPNDIDKIENCTKYYVYEKTENNITTYILLGYKIETTSDDGKIVTSFYYYDAETKNATLAENVTNENNFKLFMINGIDTSKGLKAE